MTRRQLSLSLLVALFAVVALAVSTSHGQAVDRIDTAAGTGTAGFGGDGGPATTALLNTPSDVSPQADGGFLDRGQANNRIRRVSAAGAIATVPGPSAELTLAARAASPPSRTGASSSPTPATTSCAWSAPAGAVTTSPGTGTPGFAGDGGPATQALLNAPQGVAALGRRHDPHRGHRQQPHPPGRGDGVITPSPDRPGGFSGDGTLATRVALDAPRGSRRCPAAAS